MDRNFLTIAIIFLISAFAWIGVTIYSANTKVEVNPNAATYTALLGKNFDRDTLNLIQERIDSNLPIKTDEYKNLKLPDEQAAPTDTGASDQTSVDVDTSLDNNTGTTTETEIPVDSAIPTPADKL